MIEIKNSYRGAGYAYTNESCNAYGDFKVENDVLRNIAINGTKTIGDVQYPFTASRNEQGNVSISGVPNEVMKVIAAEVCDIIKEVEAIAFPNGSEDAGEDANEE